MIFKCYREVKRLYEKLFWPQTSLSVLMKKIGTDDFKKKLCSFRRFKSEEGHGFERSLPTSHLITTVRLESDRSNFTLMLLLF